MGVNMATYVGFETAGLPGAVLATLGLITPSIVVIIVIAGFLEKFRQSKTVDSVFRGLRPASTALIAAAGLSVALSVFVTVGGVETHTFTPRWPVVVLSAIIFLCTQQKKLKKLHPVAFIAIAAVVGAVFQF